MSYKFLSGTLDSTTGVLNASEVSASGPLAGDLLTIRGFAANWTNASRTVADMGTVTTIDINGGSIDGAAIGAAAIASGSFSGLSASTDVYLGNVGAQVFMEGATDHAIAVADDSVLFFDNATRTIKRDTIVDLVTGIAGTVATTGLKDASGTLAIDIENLDAEVIATGDKLIFNDAGDNGIHSETVDDLFSIGPALVADATMTPADDFITFLDGGASGAAKKEKWSDFATLIAGTNITATDGVLAAGNPSIRAIGNANADLAVGVNYLTTSLGADRTYTLPASPSTGDIVRVKMQHIGSNTAIISKAGSQTIDGQTTINIQSNFGAVTLCYVATNVWMVL